MKIAVLSDVHGNVPALDAVLEDLLAWRPDEIIVNGDLVSRGPYSLRCLRRLQAAVPRCRYIKGNHESFVVACADTPPDPGHPTFELSSFAQWTARQLGDAVDELRRWSEHFELTDTDGGSIHVTHGSRLGNRDGIHPHLDDDELAPRLGDAGDLFVGSHTHLPLTRRFNGTLVVNTGSVGQPLDGDARAAYGRFVYRHGRWHAQIARVAYDRERAVRDFHDSGFLEQCGPLARLIHLEVAQSRMHVGRWMARYLGAVKSERITVAAAVGEYLRRAA